MSLIHCEEMNKPLTMLFYSPLLQEIISDDLSYQNSRNSLIIIDIRLIVPQQHIGIVGSSTNYNQSWSSP